MKPDFRFSAVVGRYEYAGRCSVKSMGKRVAAASAGEIDFEFKEQPALAMLAGSAAVAAAV